MQGQDALEDDDGRVCNARQIGRSRHEGVGGTCDQREGRCSDSGTGRRANGRDGRELGNVVVWKRELLIQCVRREEKR